MKIKHRSAIAGSIIAIVLLAIHFAKPPPGGLWLRTFYESSHVPLFGIIAICALIATPSRWGDRKKIATVIVAIIGLSVLSEVAQIPTGRDASLKDLVADWLGAAGFVALAIAFSRNLFVRKGRPGYLAILGVALISWPLLPLAKVSVAYVERFQIQPALVNFDSSLAGTFFHLQNARLTKRKDEATGSVSTEIELQDGPWPGIVFHDLWPDWEPYSALIVEIENPGRDDLSINIRVDDRDHQRGEQRFGDRFNQEVNLKPGTQTLRILLADIKNAPDTREMDMTEIHRLIIFGTRQESGRRFLLHTLRLE